MKTNININAFADVLNKYKLTDPVPDEVQDRMLRTKSRIFIRVLKTIGKYTLLSWLIHSLFFAVKKAGIFFYVKTIITVAVIGAVTAGSYTLIKSFTAEPEAIVITAPAQVKPVVPPVAPVKKKIVEKKKVIPPEIKYSLGIISFTSTSIDTAESDKLTGALLQNLIQLKGKEYANIFNEKATDVQYTLFGTVEKLDDTYTLGIKIVDLKSSGIMYVTQESADTISELEDKCADIAKDISTGLNLK